MSMERERELRLKLAKALQDCSAARHEVVRMKDQLASSISQSNNLRDKLETIQEENFDLRQSVFVIEAEKSFDIRLLKAEKEKEIQQLKGEIDFLNQQGVGSTVTTTHSATKMSNVMRSSTKAPANTTRDDEWPEITPTVGRGKLNGGAGKSVKKRKLNDGRGNIEGEEESSKSKSIPVLPPGRRNMYTDIMYPSSEEASLSRDVAADNDDLMLKVLLSETGEDFLNLLASLCSVDNAYTSIEDSLPEDEFLMSQRSSQPLRGTPEAVRFTMDIDSDPSPPTLRSYTAPTVVNFASAAYQQVTKFIHGKPFSFVSIIVVLSQLLSLRPINNHLIISALHLIYSILSLKYEKHLLWLSKHKPETLFYDNVQLLSGGFERLGLEDVPESSKERLRKWVLQVNNLSCPDDTDSSNPTSVSDIVEAERCIEGLISLLIQLLQEAAPLQVIQPSLQILGLLAHFASKTHMVAFYALASHSLYKGIFCERKVVDDPENLRYSIMMEHYNTQLVALNLIGYLVQSESLLSKSAAYSTPSSSVGSSMDIYGGEKKQPGNKSLISLICGLLDRQYVGDQEEDYMIFQVRKRIVRLFSEVVSNHFSTGIKALFSPPASTKEGGPKIVVDSSTKILPRLAIVMYRELSYILSSDCTYDKDECEEHLTFIKEMFLLMKCFVEDKSIPLRGNLVKEGAMPYFMSAATMVVNLHHDHGTAAELNINFNIRFDTSWERDSRISWSHDVLKEIRPVARTFLDLYINP